MTEHVTFVIHLAIGVFVEKLRRGGINVLSCNTKATFVRIFEPYKRELHSLYSLWNFLNLFVLCYENSIF